ncbi:LOW QUALITY PROTEIN: BLOC-1-related complex subunit 6 [Aquila chrysaetos chrysaetos]|uniref:LOW QUALITY PROTEIN: BLOC-1-related complex subunit 6 n=1 Tax=Aquila chrysaetos chrysaetos TaxID=223781 RepID=UPI001176D7C5|nr:LOW QUALITY PROTEIN: BLOC-1-related complex subunit 6 [Aquila chrysaetos chrysaetos]
MVAQSDPLLGEHGGGVKGAASGARCCYPSGARPLPPPRQSPCEDGASGTPLHRAPPISAKRWPLWPRPGQSEATQTLGAAPSSAGRPIRADTSSGHAPVSESRARSAKRTDGTGRFSLESRRPIGRRTNSGGHAPARSAANRGRRKQAAARPLLGGGAPAGRTHASPAMEVPAPALRPVAAAGPPAAAAAAEEEGPGREAAGRRRDERSLEALSLADWRSAAEAAARSGAAAAGDVSWSEGRRATLASALELEGTVLREGRLTQFVANNLERRIRLSGAPRAEPPAAAGGGGGSIPAIDPGALQDVVALAGQVAAQVDELLRNVHCGLQALTALSVGCIQTYRDGVESLGEAADLSIRAMYALVARCEELDRAMQPVPALAKRIRDMKGTLERLEGLCK